MFFNLLVACALSSFLLPVVRETFERMVNFRSWLTFDQFNREGPEETMSWSGNFPCVRELGDDGHGRYPRLIEAEFPPGMVSVRESSRNMVCFCLTDTLMTCRIRLVKNSIPYDAVTRRFDRSDLTRLLPFYPFMMPRGLDSPGAPLAFQYEGCPEPKVSAIIQLIVRDQKSHSDDSASSSGSPSPGTSRQRRNSSPPLFRYTEKKISKHLCGAGSGDVICPITHEELSDGNVVYILRQDSTRLAEGKSVICISSEGLKQLASQRKDGRFIDPFHRTQRHLLSIENDFEAYMIRTPREEGPSFSTDAINSGMQSMQIASSSNDGENQTRDNGEPGPSNSNQEQNPSRIGLQAAPDFVERFNARNDALESTQIRRARIAARIARGVPRDFLPSSSSDTTDFVERFNARNDALESTQIRRARIAARIARGVPRDFLPSSSSDTSDSNSSSTTNEEHETSSSNSNFNFFSLYFFFMFILTSLYIFITREKGHSLDVNLLT